MPEPTTSTAVINFLIGCGGAVAPEALRLYNLRAQPSLRWSWQYVLLSLPFVLVGGVITWVSDPTSKWAAFYTGLSTPVLLTTALKDTAKAQKDLEDIEKELDKVKQEREQLALQVETQGQKLLDALASGVPLATAPPSAVPRRRVGAAAPETALQESPIIAESPRRRRFDSLPWIVFIGFVGCLLSGFLAFSLIHVLINQDLNRISGLQWLGWTIGAVLLAVAAIFGLTRLAKPLGQVGIFREFLKGL